MNTTPARPAPHIEPVFESGLVDIFRFTLGPFETNCYVIVESHASAPRCVIVDASFEPLPMIALVRLLDATPDMLLLTHAHIDHIAGAGEVVHTFADLPIVIHTDERDWLTDPQLNMSATYGMPVTTPKAGRLLKHGDELDLAGSDWEVRHTPGHSPGSVSIYCKDIGVVIAGDALFAGSIGRTDFPLSNHEQLIAAIQRELYSLPDDTIVFPGHGPETTIGTEKASNPFVRG